MLRLHPEGRPVHEHEAAHGEGILGRLYRRVAAPVVRSRRSAWIFLISVGVATLLVCVLFVTRSVTVKLLPFDNKSELAVVVDLPEGATLEDTERTLFAIAGVARQLPEIRAIETYAGTPAPFNFNGLVRHYYVRELPELGELNLNLAPRDERGRSSHAIALDLRARLKTMSAAGRHGRPRGRSAARPAGAGDAAGRGLRPRLDQPPRRGRRTEEDLRVGAVHRRYRRFDRRAAAAPAHLDRSGPPRILRRRAARRLRHHPGAVRRHRGRLFAPRRRPQSDRDRGAAAETRSVLERAAGLDAGSRPTACPATRPWSNSATSCA